MSDRPRLRVDEVTTGRFDKTLIVVTVEVEGKMVVKIVVEFAVAVVVELWPGTSSNASNGSNGSNNSRCCSHPVHASGIHVLVQLSRD